MKLLSLLTSSVAFCSLPALFATEPANEALPVKPVEPPKRESLFTSREQTTKFEITKQTMPYGVFKTTTAGVYSIAEHEKTNEIYYGLEGYFGGTWTKLVYDFAKDVPCKCFGFNTELGLRGGYTWEPLAGLKMTPYLKLTTSCCIPAAQHMGCWANLYQGGIGFKSSYALRTDTSIGLDLLLFRNLANYSRLGNVKGWQGMNNEKFGYRAAVAASYKPERVRNLRLFIEPSYASYNIASKGKFGLNVGAAWCY